MDRDASSSGANDAPSSFRVEIQTLGRLRLVPGSEDVGGKALPDAGKALLDAGKPLALLVYLACSPARQARRDRAIDLLWADLEPDAAKHALRQTLWYIKKRVGDGCVTTVGDVLRLSDRVSIDRDAFEAAAEAQEGERVVALYRGDFLPGFAAPGGAEFEAWADLERRRLRAVFVRAVESTTRELLRQGKTREAVGRARQARAVDPLRQASWRLLVEALMAARDWAQAQVECDALELHLAADEMEPEPATRALVRAARQGPHMDGMDGMAGRADAAPMALAVQLVGREREFASLLDGVAQVQRGPGRHVHVRAAAGLGKSRLLGDLHHRLRGARTRSILVRCDLNGRELPCALASDLAVALGVLPGARGISPGSAAALVGMAPALSTSFPVAPDRGVGREALRRRCQAMAELATAVSEDKALVVLVDDIHWMDAESRVVMGHLLSRLAAMRLLLVTAGRPVAEGRLEDAGADEVELRPLSKGQVGELVASVAILGSDDAGATDADGARAGWGGRLVHELWRSTGGSPLLIVETLQLLGERGLLVVDGGEWRMGDAPSVFDLLQVGGALARRVDALPRDQRWLLTLLSVAGCALPETVLRDATGSGSEDVTEALRLLERRGLVSRTEVGWGIVHDEMAMTVLEQSTGDGVRAAHAALGRRLWEDAGGSPDVARSDGRRTAVPGALASDELADLRRAAQHLVQGGEQAPRNAVFLRFVRRMRALGDARALALLAEDLLGRHAVPSVVRELVTSLPWHVRAGLTSTRRITVAAAALVAMALLPASFAMLRRAAPPAPTPLAELVVLDMSRAEPVVQRAALLPGEWIPGRAITLSAAHLPVRDVATLLLPLVEDPVRRGTWYASHRVADSGVIDIFAHTPRGSRRVTAAPGDDMLGNVSPDGRFAVASTARWNAESHYDIAVIDLATGVARAVTSGDASDLYPRWSPRGDRIAFIRRSWDDDSNRLCVVNPEGGDLTCPESLVDAGMIVDWLNEDQLLVTRYVEDDHELMVATLRDSSWIALGEPVANWPSLSPDGRFLACQCKRFGYDTGTWFVMPVGRGGEARPVATPAGASRVWVRFSAVGQPAPISVLEVNTGLAMPTAGIPHLFTARSVADGRVGSAEVRARWHSSDTSVLSIDSSTGLAMPRHPGQAIVHARLPGWVGVHRPVTVLPHEPRLLLHERWDTTWSARWLDFGTPRPRVASVGGEARLHPNGDGSLHSGVLSRRALDASRGIALDASLSLRLTKRQWQSVSVALSNYLDPAALGDDFRTAGALDGTANPWCGVQLPAGEGNRLRDRMLVLLGPNGLRFPLPREAQLGRPVHVRIQLFPDGRCGIAVDGHPLAISATPVQASRQVQVVVVGSASETESTVGPLEIWSGVRPGVAWPAK